MNFGTVQDLLEEAFSSGELLSVEERNRWYPSKSLQHLRVHTRIARLLRNRNVLAMRITTKGYYIMEISLVAVSMEFQLEVWTGQWNNIIHSDF